MAEEIKLRWPQDASPLTDEQVLNETPVMAADTADENRMVSVTIGQIAEKAGQSIAVNGQRVKAVPAGALPAQGAEQVYMELRGPGVWTWGGAEIINLTENEVGSVWWDGTAWSLEDEQELPVALADGLYDAGDTRSISGDTAINAVFGLTKPDLKALFVNKGKRYPMVNYFNEVLTSYVRFKKAFLDAVVYANDTDLYNYSLVLLTAKGHVSSGDRIDIRKKNKITNATESTYSFRTIGSGSETLSDYNREQLIKLSSGKLETVSLIANDNSFKVELTFDTSEFNNLEESVMTSADWNAFVFENSVYRTYDLGGLEQSIDEINDRLPVRFAPSGITLDNPGNIILQSDGEYSPSSGGNASFKNPIDTTKEYYVSGQMLAASATLVAYYNDNDQYIGNQFPSTGVAFTVNRQKIVPISGATKFAFSSYGTEFKLEVLEDDDVASASDLSALEIQVGSVNNQVVQNTSDIADLQEEVNGGVTPDKMVKAVAWEIEMSAREKYLRDLYAQKIIDNPSYIAPVYGAGWSENTIDPNNMERLGSMALHSSLPIHSKLRSCLVKNGVIQYFLHTDSDFFKEDGVTPSKLDGTDGDVMSLLPEYFVRTRDLSTGGAYKEILMSEDGLPDFQYMPSGLIAKYQCTKDHINNRLASVVTTNFNRNNEEVFIENANRHVEWGNTGYSLGVQEVVEIDSYTANAAQYRGATNDASLDGETNPASQNYSRNQLGRPISNINRKTARVLAENANGLIQQYDSRKSLMYLMWVEYATRNLQQPILPNTPEGYKDGGLGLGATVYVDYPAYEKYWSPQGGNAALPCGITASLGSRSGEVYFRMKNVPITSTGEKENAVFTSWGNVMMPVVSYRGIENVWGHLYDIVDNIDTKITALPAEMQRNVYYYQKNPYLTNDTDNKSGYKLLRDVTFKSSIRVITKLLWGQEGHILPIDSGETGTAAYQTYYCDSVEQNSGWNGNIGLTKYSTWSGRLVSRYLDGPMFSVMVIDVNSNRARTSDTVRLQYFPK